MIKDNPIKDERGAIVRIETEITITGKILNNSHGSVSTADVATYVNKELTRLFNNKTAVSANSHGSPPRILKINSQFTVAETMDDVSATDHLVAIDDDIEFKTKSGRMAAGVALRGGLIAHVEKVMQGGGGCSNERPYIEMIGHIAVHEILHSMGLVDEYDKDESEQLPYNYMLGASLENSNITQGQMQLILGSEHNQGSNSSKKDDVKDSNWTDSSNSDPHNSSTEGKNGTIPAVIDENY